MKKQIIALGAALGLVAAVGVGSTLAYLTDTDAVTNTFTVGQVKIDLDEDVDTHAVKTVSGADYTKLLPGQEYDKAPVVTVMANSEDCYVFVKIEDNAADVEIGKIAESWKALDGVSNVYYQTVKATETDKALDAVFTKVKVLETVTEDNKKLGNIKVTAYAIQELGFKTAKDAWDELNK